MNGRKTLAQVRNILVIRNGALGDFIVTLPVLNGLKKVLPSARVTLVGDPRFLKLAHGYVDKVIPNDFPEWYTLFRSEGEFPEPIQRLFSDVDLVISYTPDTEGVLNMNVKKMGIPWIIDGGFSPRERIETHITDYVLSPLIREGIPVFFEPSKMITPFCDRIFAEEFFQSPWRRREKNDLVVAIHPGSGSQKKCWPKEKFVELIKWAKRSLGATILLISGPADKNSIQAIWPLISDCNPFLAEDLPLTALAALLEKCTLYVGNDSGITHVAALVGVPTLALFGPTDPRIWGPRHEKVKCLSSLCACSPCSPRQMAECQHQTCLESLPIVTVKKALVNLLTRFCFPCRIPKKSSWLKEEKKYV